jgi:Bacterial pre-peptidase C-terminal domain
MAIDLFNPNYYAAANPDLGRAGLTTEAQLRSHFQTFGLNEGRPFSPIVDLNFYQANNSDLRNAGLVTNQQLLNHLQTFGVAEGRRFSPVYNTAFYQAANPDLVKAGLNNEQLAQHFQTFGINEGRTSSPAFNVRFYLDANPDLKLAGLNFQQALEHYVTFGIGEGRNAAPLTDPGNSISQALDIGSLIGTRTFNQFVGTTDPNDFYRFTLTRDSRINLTLSGLTQDLDVEIIQDFDNDGIIDFDEELFNSRRVGTATDSITGELVRGNYFIRVFPGIPGASSNYNLQVSSTPTTVKPGEILRQALDLGVLTENRTLNDSLPLDESEDYYQFTIPTFRNVRVSLTGLADDLNVRLIRDFNNNGRVDSGEVVVSSTNTGTQNDEISTFLDPGTYFVNVYPGVSTASSNYTLAFSK